jgi:NAD-dependent SIR2 family protein deacetylase
MSVDRKIYVGPYLDVTIPIVCLSKFCLTCSNKKCTNYKKTCTGNFCKLCGSPLDSITFKEEHLVDIHEIMLNELNNQDLLSTIYKPDGNVLLISNFKEQGGFRIDSGETIEYSLENINEDLFKQKDWINIMNKLEEHKIGYIKKIGIINYYT